MPLVLDNPNSGSGYYFDDPSNTAVPVVVGPVNMTAQTVAVGDNWVKVGNSYIGSSPNGAVTGGTSALSWATPSGLADGNSLTIATDGTNPFGDTGPNFVMLVDAYKLSTGKMTVGDIEIGSGVTFTDPDTTEIFDVVTDPNIGKGWKVGTTDTGINGTGTTRLRVTHPASVRQFESCMSIWPEANQQNAIPVIADNQNNIVTWQMKPIWNLANAGTFNDNGTNYFTRRTIGTGLYNSVEPPYFLTTPSFSTNMLAQSQGFPSPVNGRDPSKSYNLPYSEVYTIESLYDQGTQTTTPDGFVSTFETREGAVLTNATITDKVMVNLSEPNKDSVDGPTSITHFTYPGFMRGYSIPEGYNFIDGDLYKAIGDGAACRVVLSNNADYFQSTKRAIQVVDSADWTNNQITVNSLRTGIFQGDLTGLYLNLIGADNTQIGSVAV